MRILEQITNQFSVRQNEKREKMVLKSLREAQQKEALYPVNGVV